MCELAYHNCPTCGEEYRCNQPNSECPVMNHYESSCQKCEFWSEDEQREIERRERWVREMGWDHYE